MGWGEKNNPRSEWYRKRHPAKLPYDFKEPILKSQSGELIPRENIFNRWFKKLIGQVGPQRATEPKGEKK